MNTASITASSGTSEITVVNVRLAAVWVMRSCARRRPMNRSPASSA